MRARGDEDPRVHVHWYVDLRSGSGNAHALDPAVRAALLATTAGTADVQGAERVRSREAAAAAERAERARSLDAERAAARRRAVRWGYPVFAILVVLLVDFAIVNSVAPNARGDQDPGSVHVAYVIGYSLIPILAADVPIIVVLVFVGWLLGIGEAEGKR